MLMMPSSRRSCRCRAGVGFVEAVAVVEIERDEHGDAIAGLEVAGAPAPSSWSLAGKDQAAVPVHRVEGGRQRDR